MKVCQICFRKPRVPPRDFSLSGLSLRMRTRWVYLLAPLKKKKKEKKKEQVAVDCISLCLRFRALVEPSVYFSPSCTFKAPSILVSECSSALSHMASNVASGPSSSPCGQRLQSIVIKRGSVLHSRVWKYRAAAACGKCLILSLMKLLLR